MALLLVWTWVKEKIMPLGAFKAALMGTAGVSTADLVLLNTTTITSDTDSVTWNSSVITSTYSQYLIKCYITQPATDVVAFTGQLSIDNGSNFNVATTSTHFAPEHTESAGQDFGRKADHEQDTGYITYAYRTGSGSDECLAMSMKLFNPSSTTYVKHFIIESQMYDGGGSGGGASVTSYVAGYANTTTAINAMNLKFSSGNIANGIFKIWGVK
jgi:hypothetical protein